MTTCDWCQKHEASTPCTCQAGCTAPWCDAVTGVRDGRLHGWASHLWTLAELADRRGHPTVTLDAALARFIAADLVDAADLLTPDTAGGVNAAFRASPAMDGHDDPHTGPHLIPVAGPSLSSAAGGPSLCPDCHHTMALHRTGGCTTNLGVLGPGIGPLSICPCDREPADA